MTLGLARLDIDALLVALLALAAAAVVGVVWLVVAAVRAGVARARLRAAMRETDDR
ncbi:hypothetical protein SAMN02745121_01627 [Nannocystis exedens]|uniref:Uncharacterized protein n=1 Tax=Nannocystis exedens TaxID=54 RepID=A0A1I1V924_9BACT|nr:hypothetical protein [Nannocystis exedens]PCC72450.1 hypothetical protein NAEX_05530 [Nannocystis exedens]SFD79369.1 hypothetical protein SAMN02745121_01627 [Nannocystis exedens]